ncbi:MAG: class I SAM-dependent methyltransferase [Chloroflexota bacterium]
MDFQIDPALYYDYQEFPIDDIDFYKAQIPSPQANVLELGCGTGRVLIPLSAHCRYIHGIDLSNSMLQVCCENMAKANLLPEQARVEQGDIANLELGTKFDLITAPFRVFQLLTEDQQIQGFFETVRKHLAPGGKMILNAFRPFGPPKEILTKNSSVDNHYDYDLPFKDGRLMRFHTFRQPAIWEGEKLVFFPNLIYQYWFDGELIEESLNEISMRVWYPNQLLDLIETHSFNIVNRWGGYQGEDYGAGPELVIAFGLED